MLFSSDVFLFLFLPVWLGLFTLVSSRLRPFVNHFVSAASLLFYTYYDIALAPVILVSISANWALARFIAKTNCNRALLAAGVGINLAYLAYFKYACFIAGNLQWVLPDIPATCSTAIPLGISFFTFQQIAYLVDLSRTPPAERRQPNLVDYTAFVSFFPQLIAGPIARANELLRPMQNKAYTTS